VKASFDLDDVTVERNSVPTDGNPGECAPMVHIPAWWSGFLFHVLNPRQISMYVYLIMLADERGVCHPTIEQIRKDLGLLSTTMVFESIAVLEEYGFFVRSRQTLPESRSRRNVYRRTACEYTILRLLETNKVDGRLNATGGNEAVSEDAKQLVQEGLQEVLGSDYARYTSASEEEKRDVLIDLINAMLRGRPSGIYFC
jgi:SOS-response transcriptional repressor LexA